MNITTFLCSLITTAYLSSLNDLIVEMVNNEYTSKNPDMSQAGRK